MNSRRYVWIVTITVLVSATLACGGGSPAPTQIPLTPTSASTPTLSASEHVALGMEYYEQGKYDEAIAEFQRAIELDPDSSESHRNLGAAYLEQGKLDEAVASYEKAIELDPGFGEAYGDLAAAYIDLGKLAEAVAAGDKAIALAPEYANAHYNLGLTYANQGRFEKAITEYKEAIRINPDDAITHNNLGIAYYEQGQTEEAIAEWEEAIKLDPDYAVPHSNLGLAYRDRGRAKEAIAAFETYLQLQPDTSDREAVEQEIAKLREQVGGGIEHSNAAGGYRLRYPEGWYHIENGAETSLAPSKEDYEASSLESPLITFISWPLAQATESLGLEEDAAPEEFLQVMAKGLKAEIGEMEGVEILGYPAAVAATSGALQDTPYEGDMIIILVEERLFLAEALAPPDQWDDFRPMFVDMIHSLSFFEPEE